MTEATSKHSPLPWEFSDGSIWAISPWNARVRIATIHRHSPMNGIDSDANGRLMKAASKLLEALEHAPVIRLGETLEGFRERYSAWYRDFRHAAIAEATGRAA